MRLLALQAVKEMADTVVRSIFRRKEDCEGVAEIELNLGVYGVHGWGELRWEVMGVAASARECTVELVPTWRHHQ